jgi:hypothetical protein
MQCNLCPKPPRGPESIPISDFDIQRLAYLFIHLDGEEATAKARKMVEEMRRMRDHDGAGTWLRVIVAIGELGEPPVDVQQIPPAKRGGYEVTTLIGLGRVAHLTVGTARIKKSAEPLRPSSP